jgi:hypothetical protein
MEVGAILRTSNEPWQPLVFWGLLGGRLASPFGSYCLLHGPHVYTSLAVEEYGQLRGGHVSHLICSALPKVGCDLFPNLKRFGPSSLALLQMAAASSARIPVIHGLCWPSQV